MEAGADVNVKGYDGRTALHFAAHGGHEAVVKLLVVAGADINVRDCDGRKALLVAVENWHEAVVKLLVEAGQMST